MLCYYPEVVATSGYTVMFGFQRCMHNGPEGLVVGALWVGRHMGVIASQHERTLRNEDDVEFEMLLHSI